MQAVTNVCTFFGIFFILLMTISEAQYLPTERAARWSPGIPGGIPEAASPVINAVEDFNVPNDSSADATSSLQTALDEAAAQGGGVVFLQEGTYQIDGELKFNGDNIVLRGAGPGVTRLYLGYTGHAIFVGMYGRGEWQPVISAEKGNMTITVSDGSLFTPGEFAELQQLNDTALMITDPEWDVDWAQNMVGQMFEVASVDENDITFTTPLHYQPRIDRSPEVRPQRLRHHCGIEKLYIEKTANDGHSIIIKNAAYCWVRYVESNTTRNAHIETTCALGCQFSENYLHHSLSYGGGGSGYGTSLHTHTSDCLVENNIFNHLRHAMIIQNGAVGNVFAYNFSTDPVQGESDSDSLNDGWDPPDVSFHGHYAQYNLCEGNIVTEIGISDYWGPMGPGNTFFRNEVSGNDGMLISDHSHRQNIIGNRTTAWTDDGTSEDILFHGNVVGSENVQWDESSGLSKDLPSSLFLKEKPTCWKSTLPWPAIGSDCNGTPQNPASLRWESGNYFEDASAVYQYHLLPVPLQSSAFFPVRFTSERVVFHSNSNGIIQINDLLGKCLYHSFKVAGTHSIQIPICSGMYLVHCFSPNKQKCIVRKMIVP